LGYYSVEVKRTIKQSGFQAVSAQFPSGFVADSSEAAWIRLLAIMIGVGSGFIATVIATITNQH
jgi:hypothetical protein